MTCKRCGKDHSNDPPYNEEEALSRAGDEIAREIDKEVILQAGAMMSDKGYSEGSYDHPGYKETQARWHALFAQLAKESRNGK